MARIIFKPDNIVHDVEDGSPLIDCCDEVDVSLSFGCTEGTCGVCELTVLEGMKNLSRVSEEEREYLYEENLEAGMRLGCQLKIKRGEVMITWKKNKTN